MSFYPTTDTTPPCAEKCWEHIPGGWRYVRSVTHCGHRYDPHERLWRWDIKKLDEGAA